MASLYDSASLVMIPSGVKDGKAYSIKPTDGSGDFTFSRGTGTATRVNASGLIEKERSNQLLQSNSFDTTWDNVNNAFYSLTSGQSGYDGTNNAWLLDKLQTTNTYVTQNVSVSNVCTLSIYAKAGTADVLMIYSAGANDGAMFNLADGVNIVNASSPIDASMEAVGGGWYRCQVVVTSSSSFYIKIQDGSYGDTTGSIYIQDAQLEQGLVATDYIETTTAAVYEGITDNLPRLDYSGGASCPSLLLEPSRSNLVSLSEYIGGWSGTNMGVVNNDATSPEGVVNAAEIESTSTNASHYIGSPNFSMTSGVDYTGSMFVKAGTGRYFQLFFGGTPFTSVGYANFDLQEGVVTAEGSAVTGDIEPYANDWYRVSISGTSAATGTGTLYAAAITSGSAARIQAHNSVLSYNIWGAQCEAGNYATSIIPTYGTAASRAGDSCVKTGISSLIGQTEGTFFFEIGEKTTESIGIFEAGQGSAQYRFFIYTDTSKKLKVLVVDNFAVQVSYTSSVNVESNAKIAIAYASNDYAIYMNGSQLSTDTSASVPPMNQLAVGSDRSGVATATNNTKQALVFKTRLTNAELAALTA
jgi:hypothetical protein